MDNIQLSSLVAMDSPDAVFGEVETIFKMVSPNFDTTLLRKAFNVTVDLFNGDYPGYRACNTEYHDLRHTTDAFLSMARLVHGGIVDGQSFTQEYIVTGLIAALFHDSGYIQQENDLDGTGAKYTINHVRRSMDFLESAGVEIGMSLKNIQSGRVIILCTDLSVDLSEIFFPDPETEILGKILGSADLLAQLADRTYLEKLLFLYREFKEAGLGNYDSELDLLKKTIRFYDFVSHRLEKTLDSAQRFMTSHFTLRWNIEENMYQRSIKKQRDYLQKILDNPDSDPLNHLKRGGIVEKIRMGSP